MEPIYIIKSLLIGILGAGGFYFIMAFVFHYFPIPMFMYIRTRMLTWLKNRHKRKGSFAAFLWKVTRFILVLFATIAWWGAFGLYTWLLYKMLAHYIPSNDNNFLSYYAIAVAIPTLWVLIRYIRFYFPKKESTPYLLLEDDKRTLFEQMEP